MSETAKTPEGRGLGYEPSNVNGRQLFAFAAGVVGLVVFGVLVSAGVFHFFVQHQSLGPPASPFENARQLPPNPRLQVEAPQDLKEYRAAQDKVLDSYGWVDSNAGVVRIPIDRAMALLLQKGYPTRGATPATGQGETPGATPPPADRQTAPTPIFGEEVR
jgi:hypothetical protein